MTAKTVLITGASRGIGLLTAQRLIARGHRVFAGMRTPQPLPGAHVFELDVTHAQARERAVEEVLREAGHLDVLINNAGAALGGFFEDVDDDELRAQFETNFFAVAALCRAVLPSMRARGVGRIVNVSSVAGLVGQPCMSSYCASKFALEGLSESMRHELTPFGVQVVLVEPGSFKTEIFTDKRWVARRAFDTASPYAALSRRIETRVNEMHARLPHADIVARALVRAATVKRPRLRYRVGTDAHALTALTRIVPPRVVESGVQWALRHL